MMNFTGCPSGSTSPRDTSPATLFLCLCLQSLLNEVVAKEFCLVVASSVLGVAMLVIWMFGGLSWPSILYITLPTLCRAMVGSSVLVRCL